MLLALQSEVVLATAVCKADTLFVRLRALKNHSFLSGLSTFLSTHDAAAEPLDSPHMAVYWTIATPCFSCYRHHHMCLLETAIKLWQSSSAIPTGWGKENQGRDKIRGSSSALGSWTVGWYSPTLYASMGVYYLVTVPSYCWSYKWTLNLNSVSFPFIRELLVPWKNWILKVLASEVLFQQGPPVNNLPSHAGETSQPFQELWKRTTLVMFFHHKQIVWDHPHRWGALKVLSNPQ